MWVESVLRGERKEARRFQVTEAEKRYGSLLFVVLFLFLLFLLLFVFFLLTPVAPYSDSFRTALGIVVQISWHHKEKYSPVRYCTDVCSRALHSPMCRSIAARIPVCMFFSLVCMCLYVCIYFFQYGCFCPFVCLFIYSFVWLLRFSLSVCLVMSCLYVCMSVRVSVYLCVWQCVCVCVSVCMWLPVWAYMFVILSRMLMNHRSECDKISWM